MATQKVVTANPYHNNGATVYMGGNVNTSAYNAVITRNVDKTLAAVAAANNTLPATGESQGRRAFYPTGTLMKNTQFLASKVTTAIASVPNTVLRKMDRAIVDSIHKIESITTRLQASGFRAGNFNIYSGKFVSAIPTISTSFGQDHAARPSLAIPGELVFRDGDDVPTLADYPARTTS